MAIAAVVVVVHPGGTSVAPPRLGADGCLAASPRVARFPLTPAQPAPLCRHGLGGTLDVPLGGRQHAGRYDPDPACGEYDPARGCVPSAFGQGNARVRRATLRTHALVAVVDSFGRPFAYVRSVAPGCFDVFAADKRRVGSTDPARDGRRPGAGCDPAHPPRARAVLELQGRACMATPRLQDDHVLAGLVPARGTPEAPRNTGLRGFIASAALPPLTSAEQRHLRDADPGCGRAASAASAPAAARRLLPAGELRTADDFVDRPAATHPSALDRYVSPRNLRCVRDTRDCSGFYANYQGPCSAPDIALLAVSSTAVSGVGSTPDDNPGAVRTGGVVRAVVRRDAGRGSFRVLDVIGAPDPNVPRGQGAVATWAFGDANPQADARNRAHPPASRLDRQQHIYGWTPVRRPRVPAARFSCRAR